MRRKVMGGAAIGVLLAAISACIFVLPNLIVSQDLGGVEKDAKPLTQAEFLKARNDVRAALIQGLGALLVLAGASIAAVASFRQLQINREGQVTERFAKAIDQLGNQDNVDIRLGGIYSLAQIGQDPSQLEPVTSILSAFLAEHSPWPPPEDADYPADYPLSELPPLRHRAPDLQAALQSLGALGNPKERTKPFIVLIATDLRRAAINADYYGAYFSGSNLARCNFGPDTDLRSAQLADAILEECYGLGSRRLEGAIATQATVWPTGFDPASHGISVGASVGSFGRRITRRKQGPPT